MTLPNHDVNSVICSHNLSFFISCFPFYPPYILFIINLVFFFNFKTLTENSTECEDSIVRMAFLFYKF